MAKKKLGPNDFWASKVYRTKSNGKEYLFARVRRRYSESDVETKGPGQWEGMIREERYDLITDTDIDSETFGQRIRKPNAQAVGTQLRFTKELNDKNVKDFQKMCANMGAPFGQTVFIFKFKNINIETDSEDDFWNMDFEEAYKRHTGQKQVVVVGEDKHNTRRKSLK